MNDIHVGNIRITPGQTREAAARELKTFVNDVLEEVLPELGRVEQVSLPLEYADTQETCFGFITMVDRNQHLAVIDRLDRLEYKCRSLLLTIGRRAPSALDCRAVRESRRRYAIPSPPRSQTTSQATASSRSPRSPHASPHSTKRLSPHLAKHVSPSRSPQTQQSSALAPHNVTSGVKSLGRGILQFRRR